MPEPTEMEFDLLVRRARELGFFLQRHRHYDPCSPGGDLYIQEGRRFTGQHCETLLRYATEDQCWKFLNENK